jgi:hypothetical protein
MVGLLGLPLAGTGCSSVAEVTTAELAAVVARDGVVFTEPTIPDPVLDRLAENRVVVIGETHHLREHYTFTADLLRELYERGFRQLLVEQPQMADWILDDYVAGSRLDPDWTPPANWVRKFAAIRELNATLPEAERVHVRAIDVNEAYYGGASSFRGLAEMVVTHLPSAGPLTAFLQADYGSRTSQTEAIESLQAALEADRSSLTASWGTDWYDVVVEMVAVERASIDIRAYRESDDDRAARAREEVIKQLADARIGGTAARTVINIGGNHAQKSHLKGTKQEWLGDYLVHRSTAPGGPVTVVAVVAARIELEPGNSGSPYDVRATSPENELFRLMAETWPDRTVFLALDDPVFSAGGVPVNFEETIYVCALKEQYDAVLQYGLAHRVPSD